ncbi:MAG: sodium-dependent transporter [Victivallales bacterium]|nr:sodium-dependent transporter [Victivallales bacterium]
MANNSPREHWGSGIGFILAATGSAVGLGNIWKFPYITGENGGGAFVLIYLVCIAVIGIPVMLCEMSLGRHTQKNPIGAFGSISPESSKLSHFFGLCMLLTGMGLLLFHNYGMAVLMFVLGALVFAYSWRVVGFCGVFAGFVILSFYSVVAGWTIAYFGKALSGGLDFVDKVAAEQSFSSLVANPYYSIGCHLGFMFLCVVIVMGGVKKGIERWSKILMSLLFLLLFILILRGLSLPGATQGVAFMLSPDFSAISTNSVLIALGHAFFTLSLGMGAIITYGSYVSKDQNLFLSTLSIVALDTLVAILAGLAIFPAVFAFNMEPSAGPGLVFNTVPLVMTQMPGGIFWAGLFFLLLIIAALTSGISLLEVVVAAAMDELKIKRTPAVIGVGCIIGLLGCLCAVSVSDWTRVEWLHSGLTGLFGVDDASFFDFMDNIASNWLLPLGGISISIFVGWVWGTRKAVEEIRHGSHNFADVHLIALLAGLKDDPSHNSDYHVLTLAALWGIFIRFISPVAVMIAFLYNIGWI